MAGLIMVSLTQWCGLLVGCLYYGRVFSLCCFNILWCCYLWSSNHLFVRCVSTRCRDEGGWLVRANCSSLLVMIRRNVSQPRFRLREPKQTERSATTLLKTLLNIKKSWNKWKYPKNKLENSEPLCPSFRFITKLTHDSPHSAWPLHRSPQFYFFTMEQSRQEQQIATTSNHVKRQG